MPRAEWAQVAHDLRALAESIDAAIEPSAARADVQDRVPSRPAAAEAGVPPAPASAPSIDTSACPKHGKPWASGQYGEFCKAQTDDPAWGKEKIDRDGNKVYWCRITPKNAPQWVAVNKAAPQMDVDDIPF